MISCQRCKMEHGQEFDSCVIVQISNENKIFDPIKYGEENYGDYGLKYEVDQRCHDCGVKLGGYHHSGCDWEQCPKCKGQALGCECSRENYSNQETKFTPAQLLHQVVHYATVTGIEEDRSDFLVQVVAYDENNKSIECILYDDPDIFLQEIEWAIVRGWRPIAVECLEYEEKDFACISLYYFEDELSAEDIAIVDGMFIQETNTLN